MSSVRELQSRSMRYFMAVYECGGYGEAAQALCITQPALSNSISKLESLLGIRLFERGPGGTRSTAYADALYRRAKLVCAELDLAVKELHELEDAQKGIVRVGFGPSVQEVFSDILLRLITERPRLTVTVTQAHAESLITGLHRGELDLVVCTAPQHLFDDELEVSQLAEIPTLPVARQKHPLSGKRFKKSAIADYPWIIADIKLEPLSKNILEAFPEKRPETIVTSNSPAFTKLIVSKSDFITFMPATLIGGADFDGKLVALGNKQGLYRTPLVIITRKNNVLPSAGRIIMTSFKRKFGCQPE